VNKNLVLKLENPLSIPSDLSGTGWDLPSNMTLDQYKEAGNMLSQLDQSKQWWLGDWWNAGVEWGNGENICNEIGISYSSAKTAGSIATKFEKSTRVDKLSFTHHREVCIIDDAEVRQRFLTWCLFDNDGVERDKPKSTRELIDAVRAYLDEEGWTESERERREIVKNGGTVTAHRNVDEHLMRWAEMNSCLVRIDRGSDWGNPFILPDDGDRSTVIRNFGTYIEMKPSLLNRLDSMKGKVLGCWCHPEPCHGDEIIRRLK
jgi:hypothetical protein